MHISWKMLQTHRKRQVRKRWLGTLAVVLLLVALGVSLHTSGSRPESADSNSSPVLSARPSEPEHVFVRTIQAGDTLSSIFDRFNINQGTMYQILAADEALLALDVLRPGHVLTLTLDKQTRQLEEMELFVHAGSRVVYRRVNDSGFDFEEIIQPGTWEQELLEGEINGSFFVSATRAGLTDGETAAISDLFKDQLNFRREIKAGDRFQVVRKRQFVEGEYTGQSRIEGVRILRPSRLTAPFYLRTAIITTIGARAWFGPSCVFPPKAAIASARTSIRRGVILSPVVSLPTMASILPCPSARRSRLSGMAS
jgi:murein DD-endopeptidase